jgi:ankyrin repeat protein
MQISQLVKTIPVLILAALFMSGCATIGFSAWSYSTITNGDYNEIQRQIDEGANVNAWIRLHYRKTKPLIVAAGSGHTEIVKLFIEEGADVNAVTRKKGIPPKDMDYGWTALMAASGGGYLEIIRVLLEAGADVNPEPTYRGATPLRLAVENENQEIIKLLLEAGADIDAQMGTPLWLASYLGHFEVVKLLLEQGADIDNGGRALQAASNWGHLDPEIVRLLLEAGTDVNAQDNLGLTALMGSSARGHIEITRILIEAGADVNVQDYEGYTALMYASGAKYSWLDGNINPEIVRLLLEAGANVNAKNIWGRTALQFALRRKETEIVDLLVAAGAEED